jgi:hypothetical protein
MSKKPINDPLESAKISQDAPKKRGWGRSNKEDGDNSSDEMAVPAAVDVPVTPKPERPVVHAAPEPKPAPAGVFKFKVVKTTMFSYGGQMTRLKADSVISSQHYGGMPGIEKIKAAGVLLEPIE